MFHRVKSETSQTKADHQATTQAEQPAQSTLGIQQNNMPQQAAPAAAPAPQASAEAAQQTNPTTTAKQEKDTPTMTDQSQDNQSEEQTDTASTQTQERALDIPAAAYQRPGQAPVRPAGFGASYATGYAATPTSDVSSASERKLTIGAGITMSGEIESCDTLFVEGTVEAALKGASLLHVAESGTFYGSVEIGEATIAGRFEGDITVNGRLTIRSGGTITGSIAYRELEVEAGATIDGKITPLSIGAPAAKKSPAKEDKAAAPASKAKVASKEDQPEPANTDGELFSKAAAE